jgi:hypothetical protein
MEIALAIFNGAAFNESNYYGRFLLIMSPAHFFRYWNFFVSKATVIKFRFDKKDFVQNVQNKLCELGFESGMPGHIVVSDGLKSSNLNLISLPIKL